MKGPILDAVTKALLCLPVLCHAHDIDARLTSEKNYIHSIRIPRIQALSRGVVQAAAGGMMRAAQQEMPEIACGSEHACSDSQAVTGALTVGFRKSSDGIPSSAYSTRSAAGTSLVARLLPSQRRSEVQCALNSYLRVSLYYYLGIKPGKTLILELLLLWCKWNQGCPKGRHANPSGR